MRRYLFAIFAFLTLSACTPEQTIRAIFADRGDEAVAVARCESGLNPDAHSPGGGNHGLFQINSVHRASYERAMGVPWSTHHDPIWNANFARWLHQQQGWRPWTCQP